MSPLVETLNYLLALGTIALLLATFGIFSLYVYERTKKKASPLGALVSRAALPIIFLLTLGASVMALVYSDVFGFIPCGLCWFGRIFMFPQVLIAGAAILLRDMVFAPVYLMILAACGAAVSLYHHYIQMGGSMLLDCPTSGGDCAQRIVFEFGFVTFPLLAFSLFAFVFVILFLQRAHRKMQ